MTRALYSVLQFMPDGGRAEGAKVGVLLFVPSTRWMEVRTSPTLERVRQFFSPDRARRRRIEIAIESFKHRMELARSEFTSESELSQFAAASANTLRITAPRVVMVDEPARSLDELYLELVGDIERGVTGVAEGRGQTLPPSVAEVFGRLEAQHKVWRPGRIMLPTINRKFDIPIAYENGRVNYVRPESLAPRQKLDDKLAKLGFNGQLIYQHAIDLKEGQLVVISTDPQALPIAEDRFAKTLKEFHVRFVQYGDADAFAAEVEASAH